MNMSAVINSIRNIMRQDKGVNGDAQRLEEFDVEKEQWDNRTESETAQDKILAELNQALQNG